MAQLGRWWIALTKLDAIDERSLYLSVIVLTLFSDDWSIFNFTSVVGVAAAAAGVLFPGRPRFFCVSPWVGVLVAGVPEGVESFVSCEGVLGADCPSKRKQLNTFLTNLKAWNKSLISFFIWRTGFLFLFPTSIEDIIIWKILVLHAIHHWFLTRLCETHHCDEWKLSKIFSYW